MYPIYTCRGTPVKKSPTNENTESGSMCTLNLLSKNIVQISTHIGSVQNALSLIPFYHSILKIVFIRWVRRVSYMHLYF